MPDGSFIQTFTDITKRRQAEAYIARLASEDPLTGLRAARATCAAAAKVFGCRPEEVFPSSTGIIGVPL
ncbi:MAG: hypothetical protein ACLPX9_00405, partial [Rhodomicrobium sp.]